MDKELVLLKQFLDRIKRDIEVFDKDFQIRKDLNPFQDRFKAEEALRNTLNSIYDCSTIVSSLAIFRGKVRGLLDSSGQYSLRPTVDNYLKEVGDLLQAYRTISYGLTERNQAIRDMIKIRFYNEYRDSSKQD